MSSVRPVEPNRLSLIRKEKGGGEGWVRGGKSSLARQPQHLQWGWRED